MQLQTNHGAPQAAPNPSGAPSHALPRKFLEPMLYLADRMVHIGAGLRESRAMLNEMAREAGLADFTEQPGFRSLSDQRACDLLDVEAAKRGTLVLLALLMKADSHAGEAHRSFFTKMRIRMGADPVSVPVGVSAHRQLVEALLGL